MSRAQNSELGGLQLRGEHDARNDTTFVLSIASRWHMPKNAILRRKLYSVSSEESTGAMQAEGECYREWTLK